MSVFLEFRANFEAWVASGKARDNRHDAQTRFVNTIGQTVSKNFKHGIERENLKNGVKNLTGYDNQDGFDSALKALKRTDLSENQVYLALCLYFYILCEGPEPLRKDIEASIFVTNRKFETVFGGEDGESREYFTKQVAQPNQDDDKNSDAAGSAAQPLLKKASATEPASDYQPPLDAPPRRSDADTPPDQLEGRLRYGTQITKVFGRKTEQQQLRDFANAEAGDIDFWWTQLAGVAGQGKSRLALELIYKLRCKNWCAGFLPSDEIENFTQNAKDWAPKKPHLIVIDYVLGYEALIGDLIRSLMRKTAYPHSVRLLLLERQRRDRGGADRRTISEDGKPEFALRDMNADWYEAMSTGTSRSTRTGGYRVSILRYAKDVIELTKLNDIALVQFVHAYAGDAIKVSDDELKRRLNDLDPSGRPLFAMILADVFLNGDGPKSVDWSRTDYLDYVVSENMRKRWLRYFGEELPEIYVDHPVIRAALLATLVRGASQSALMTFLGDTYSRRLHEQVLVVQDASISQGARGPSAYVPPLEPDLLGGWMVMQALRGSVDIQAVLNEAWKLSPADTGATLRRIAADFGKEEDILDLFNAEPLEEPARVEFCKAATIVLAKRWGVHCTYTDEQIALIKRASRAGDGNASNLMGLVFHYGNGIPADPMEAVRQFELGSKQNSDFARDNWAIALSQGRGVTKDIPAAIRLLENGVKKKQTRSMVLLANLLMEVGDKGGDEKSRGINLLLEASEAGDAEAMANLAVRFEKGEGIGPANPKKAMRWYKRAAQAGSTDAMFCLAVHLERGFGDDTGNPEAALRWLYAAAKAGHIDAMTKVAIHLETGKGMEKPDPVEAMRWHREAAEAGQTESMFLFAANLKEGIGVSKPDPSLAQKWFRRAANDGHADSMLFLAMSLETGSPDKIANPEEAMLWYRKAAQSGQIKAMVCLANNLLDGIGMDAANPEEAIFWYRKAAEAGETQAMFNLAYILQEGGGVDAAEPEEATLWYRKAAEAGETQAMVNLAINLQEGVGVDTVEPEEAMIWYQRAAEAGQTKAMVHIALYLLSKSGSDTSVAFQWLMKAREAGDDDASGLLIANAIANDKKLDDIEFGAQHILPSIKLETLGKPLFRAAWSVGSEQEFHEVVSKLLVSTAYEGGYDWLKQSNFLGMQTTSLSCYGGLQLCEIQIRPATIRKTVILSALRGNDLALVLDGRSQRLHVLNAGCLDLSVEEHVDEYLRFFCEYVRVNDGAFRIVENIKDVELKPNVALDELTPELLQIGSIKALPTNSTSFFRRSAHVLFGSSLYRAEFTVTKSGEVNMDTDVPLYSNLPIKPTQYLGPVRLLEGQ